MVIHGDMDTCEWWYMFYTSAYPEYYWGVPDKDEKMGTMELCYWQSARLCTTIPLIKTQFLIYRDLSPTCLIALPDKESFLSFPIGSL